MASDSDVSPHPEVLFSVLKEKCPAFMAGCPFRRQQNNNGNDSTSVESIYSSALTKCPAFQNGCIFKAATNIQEFNSLFEKMPVSHVNFSSETNESTSTSPSSVLLSIFAEIHLISSKLKQDIGVCPILVSETETNKILQCPFKFAKCQGMSLASTLESISSNWFPVEQAIHVDDGNGDGKTCGLSGCLKSGTKKSHKAAENVTFTRRFVKGEITRPSYRRYLVALFHIYRAIEKCADSLSESGFLGYAPVHFPNELRRLPTIEKDLSYFFDDKEELELLCREASATKAVREYVDRVYSITRDEPELFVAHTYTRYLGDLSGGQILAKIGRRAMNLPSDGIGTSFYEFPNISCLRTFKNMYRSKLDSLKIDSDVVERIVAEGNVAFLLNMSVFEELDRFDGQSMVVDDTSSDPVPRGDAAKCPFASLAALAGKTLGNFHGHGVSNENTAIGKGQQNSESVSELQETSRCPIAQLYNLIFNLMSFLASDVLRLILSVIIIGTIAGVFLFPEFVTISGCCLIIMVAIGAFILNQL